MITDKQVAAIAAENGITVDEVAEIITAFREVTAAFREEMGEEALRELMWYMEKIRQRG